MVLAPLMLAIFAASSIAQPTAPIKQEQVDIAKPFKQKGQFQEVKLVNDLTGFKVELFVNKSDRALVAAEKSHADEDYSGIKGGQKSVHWLHFVVTDMKSDKKIDSGEIELDWIGKNSETVEKEVASKLKDKGITANVWAKKDALVLVIKKVK